MKDEAEAPDLWEELQRERELLGAPQSAEVGNTPLTPGELESVATEIQALKEYFGCWRRARSNI